MYGASDVSIFQILVLKKEPFNVTDTRCLQPLESGRQVAVLFILTLFKNRLERNKSCSNKPFFFLFFMCGGFLFYNQLSDMGFLGKAVLVYFTRRVGIELLTISFFQSPWRTMLRHK